MDRIPQRLIGTYIISNCVPVTLLPMAVTLFSILSLLQIIFPCIIVMTLEILHHHSIILVYFFKNVAVYQCLLKAKQNNCVCV